MPPPADQPRTPLTDLLNRGARGDDRAWNELLPRVYAELRAIAAVRMAAERKDHTLQPAALVHEAFVQLVGNERIEWRDRAQFLQAAAEGMRRILIDYARQHRSDKRSGSRRRVPIDLVDVAQQRDPEQILAVDEAILRLGEQDKRTAELVRLRFFAGLTVDEAAAVLEISPRAAAREWAYARARLFRLLSDAPDTDE